MSAPMSALPESGHLAEPCSNLGDHRAFAERDLWNVSATADQRQSALMLAARMTLPHFSVSSAMNLPKSLGELARMMLPKSANRALILGSARPALISEFSLLMISVGVLLGATRPCQPLTSKPGTKSATVGTSGSASSRDMVVTASARNLPALTCSRETTVEPR